MPAQPRLQRRAGHRKIPRAAPQKLADPFLLPNMAAAVARLLLAHERGEPLVIFGDYDVDGVTSTTLLLEVLRQLGWQADAYLPNRMDGATA